MRDRYHTYDLAQSRNLLKMACVHMSARGRRRKRHRSVTGGAVAPGATGHPPLGTPELPRAAPEAHGAPNGANLAARVRAPVTATCMAHTTRAHGRLTAHRCGANACAASTGPHTPGCVRPRFRVGTLYTCLRALLSRSTSEACEARLPGSTLKLQYQ